MKHAAFSAPRIACPPHISYQLIARRAGLDHVTVSRYFNDRDIHLSSRTLIEGVLRDMKLEQFIRAGRPYTITVRKP